MTSRFRLISCLSAALLAGGWQLQAQQGDAAPPTSGATAPPVAPAPAPEPSPGATPGTTTRPTIPTYPQTRPPFEEQERFPEIQRPIFLTGKVVLEDGTPPPDFAIIERVCNGIVRQEGYTDAKGNFSIQLGQNNALIPDASVSQNDNRGPFGTSGSSRGGPSGGMISDWDLSGCEIRASLAGYTSDSIPLIGRRALDNPDIGRIVLRRYGNVEGTTVSVTSLEAPKDAKKAYNKGRDAARKQKWTEAAKQFQKAIQIYPRYATAWYELGLVTEQSGDLESARRAYEKALEVDSRFVKPYIQLAVLEARKQNWKQLVEIIARVLRLDPFNYPEVYYMDSVAQFNLRNLEQAEHSAREAIKLDKQNLYPAANHVLGIILAQKGEYTAAAGFLKTYLKLAPGAANAAQVKNQLAQVEEMANLPR